MSFRTKPLSDCFPLCYKTETGGYAVDYQPGNVTSYRFVLSPLPAGSPEASVMNAYMEGGWLFTPYPNGLWRPLVLSKDPGFIHWEYVREKVGCTAADAVVLAEAFAYLLGGSALTKLEDLPDDT